MLLKSELVLALSTLGISCCAQTQSRQPVFANLASGSLSGIVYDTSGVPQMGALVEAVLPDARIAGSAVTDVRGRYRLSLEPGSYKVRATAALLLPAIRERLQIAGGTRLVLNLTLTTVLSADGWLPISKRTVMEPSDDWMWTLRSSSNRSILRFADSGNAVSSSSETDPVAISSSRRESQRSATSGRITLKNGEGGFARGGDHNVLVLTRMNEDGTGTVVHADFSASRSPYPVAPSADISVGIERQSFLNGYSRAVLTYNNHPELVNSRGETGFQSFSLRSAQRFDLGDVLRLDVGSVLESTSFGGSTFLLQPFLRAAVHPGSGVVIAYTATHSRGTESLEDLDSVQGHIPVSVLKNGRAQTETGSHHAISLTGKLGSKTVAEAAMYSDAVRHPTVAGIGDLARADAAADGLVVDPTTHTYRVATRNYRSSGVRLVVHQALTDTLQAGLELSTGSALQAATSTRTSSMTDVLDQIAPVQAYAATSFLRGKVLSTGTTVHASYRWQPGHTLTAVDAFRLHGDGAYLSCSVRQSLGRLRFLPQGLEALIDVQNLLAQGYQPFLSKDGETLYLAQSSRALQAGVSFSF